MAFDAQQHAPLGVSRIPAQRARQALVDVPHRERTVSVARHTHPARFTATTGPKPDEVHAALARRSPHAFHTRLRTLARLGFRKRELRVVDAHFPPPMTASM